MIPSPQTLAVPIITETFWKRFLAVLKPSPSQEGTRDVSEVTYPCNLGFNAFQAKTNTKSVNWMTMFKILARIWRFLKSNKRTVSSFILVEVATDWQKPTKKLEIKMDLFLDAIQYFISFDYKTIFIKSHFSGKQIQAGTKSEWNWVKLPANNSNSIKHSIVLGFGIIIVLIRLLICRHGFSISIIISLWSCLNSLLHSHIRLILLWLKQVN